MVGCFCLAYRLIYLACAHRAHLHTHLTLTLALLTSTRINLPATFDTRAPRAQDRRPYPSRAARQRHSGSRSRFQRFLECRACIWVVNALSTCTVNKIFGLQLVRKVRAHPTNTTAQPACPLITLCLAFAVVSTPMHPAHCLTAVCHLVSGLAADHQRASRPSWTRSASTFDGAHDGMRLVASRGALAERERSARVIRARAVGAMRVRDDCQVTCSCTCRDLALSVPCTASQACLGLSLSHDKSTVTHVKSIFELTTYQRSAPASRLESAPVDPAS